MFAVIEAKRAGLFARFYWARNIVAGIIVGIVALPLAMAFAIASGVKPEQGLYTAIIAGLVVSIFGGSRTQIAGPTGAFIVILSGIVAEHGVDGLQLATLMAGIILCFLGFSRMGGVIRYIPLPVIMGFTAGIGIVIWVDQWQSFFGLPVVQGRYFHEKIWFLLQNLSNLDFLTTAFGIGSLVLIVLSQGVQWLRSIPGPLLVLVVATVVQGIFHFPQLATIGSAFGEIPRGLPVFTWPQWSVDKLINLTGPAFAIAMLGAIESLLSAVVADSMANTRHDSNAELIGQGAANILSPLFGGIAATGAIARTATSIRSGGNSPLAGVVHAITLVLILLLLAPLARDIPLSALAAILFVVAWNMSEIPRVIRLMRRAPHADVVILSVTFLLTIFVDLVVAVNIGIALAVLHFLRRMADSSDVIPQTQDALCQELGDSGVIANLYPGVEIFKVRGPLFFAAVEHLKNTLEASQAEVVILRLEQVPFADATAIQTLDGLVTDFQSRGTHLILCGANARVTRKLRSMGVLDRLGSDGFQPDLQKALARLYKQFCQKQAVLT